MKTDAKIVDHSIVNDDSVMSIAERANLRDVEQKINGDTTMIILIGMAVQTILLSLIIYTIS